MLINREAIRRHCKDKGKRVSKSFLVQLNYMVLAHVNSALMKIPVKKRTLKASELL